MPKGQLADQAAANWTSTPGLDHLGVGSGLIEEYQLRRVQARLISLPAFTCGGDVRLVLLSGVQSFLSS